MLRNISICVPLRKNIHFLAKCIVEEKTTTFLRRSDVRAAHKDARILLIGP